MGASIRLGGRASQPWINLRRRNALASSPSVCQQGRGDEAVLAVKPCALQWGCSLVQHLLAMIGQMLIGIRVTGQPHPIPVALLPEVFDNSAMGRAEVSLQIVQQMQTGDRQAAAIDLSQREITRAVMLQRIQDPLGRIVVLANERAPLLTQ